MPNPNPRKNGIAGIRNAPHIDKPHKKHNKIKENEDAKDATKTDVNCEATRPSKLLKADKSSFLKRKNLHFE